MRRRIFSLFLVLFLVVGLCPMTALAEEWENNAPVPGENISVDLKLNDWYDLDLSQHFTDPDGDVLVYEVSADGKTWTTANLTYSYYPAGTGTQKAFFRAVDDYGNVSDILTLTATVAVPPSSVSVNLSISSGIDGYAYAEETDAVMTPVTLTVPYFDLGLYGLERYYYNPLCYADHKEGDTEYTIKDGLSSNSTKRQFVPLKGSNLVAAEFPVEVTNWDYWSTKEDIEDVYGAIEGLDSKDTVLQAFRVFSLNDRMQPDAALVYRIVNGTLDTLPIEGKEGE